MTMVIFDRIMLCFSFLIYIVNLVLLGITAFKLTLKANGDVIYTFGAIVMLALFIAGIVYLLKLIDFMFKEFDNYWFDKLLTENNYDYDIFSDAYNYSCEEFLHAVMTNYYLYCNRDGQFLKSDAATSLLTEIYNDHYYLHCRIHYCFSKKHEDDKIKTRFYIGKYVDEHDCYEIYVYKFFASIFSKKVSHLCLEIVETDRARFLAMMS